MNAVIYARYSSDNQREESIEGQLRECRAFAKTKGINIIDEYIDRAMSAKTDKRPSFQKMIKDSRQKKFDVVIVWKLDRFSRNRTDSAIYKAILSKNDVKVVSATESIADDASGILLESILEGFAEYFSADLGEKTLRGMIENALKCQYNGGVVTFGYKINSTKNYEICPVQSPIVNDIFDLYLDGKTVKGVVDYLNEKQIKTNTGIEFNISAVQRLLKNRKYMGEYSYQKIKIPNGIPAIIDTEKFEKVQSLLAKNKKAPARNKAKAENYLLTTKLICGKCGAYMIGESGTSRNKVFHQYYKCANAKKHKSCDKKTVKKDYIEKIVIDRIQEKLADDKYISDLTNTVYGFQNIENTSIAILKKQIQENEKSIKNIIRAIEEGVFTSSTKQRLNELEENKIKLETSLAREEMQKPTLSKEEIKGWFVYFRNLNMDVQREREILISAFVNAIYLYDDQITFGMNYQENEETVSLELLNCSDMKLSGEPKKQGSN